MSSVRTDFRRLSASPQPEWRDDDHAARRPFPTPCDADDSGAWAGRILQLLTAHDGSTTRLCEAIAGGPVEVHVGHQAVTHDVPAQVRDMLPGTRYIERVTSLVARGQVMTDNLVYVALDGLDASLREGLEAGTRPIGHLVANVWTRRESVDVGDAVLERLWRRVGLPDVQAMRCYRMFTHAGASMLICETYRRGMLMDTAREPSRAWARPGLRSRFAAVEDAS